MTYIKLSKSINMKNIEKLSIKKVTLKLHLNLQFENILLTIKTWIKSRFHYIDIIAYHSVCVTIWPGKSNKHTMSSTKDETLMTTCNCLMTTCNCLMTTCNCLMTTCNCLMTTCNCLMTTCNCLNEWKLQLNNST